MSQRAALYTLAVRSRSKRGAIVPLGDLDGTGTTLLAVLGGFLADFAETSPDGSRVLRSLSARQDGDDLFAIVQHGQSGVAADIVDAAGEVKLRQTPSDVQLVRCGCLFRLPPAATVGGLAVHVSNGRGMKELFEQALARRFRLRFPGLTLTIERFVERNALRDAVDQDRLEKVRLVRTARAGERAVAGTEKWVDSGSRARLALDVASRTGDGPGGAGGRIRPDLIRRYLGGDESVFRDIVAFDGMTFDAAHVEVELPDGARRWFDIAHPDAARPVTRELPNLQLDADGEPTDSSLLAGLRATLTAMSPG